MGEAHTFCRTSVKSVALWSNKRRQLIGFCAREGKGTLGFSFMYLLLFFVYTPCIIRLILVRLLPYLDDVILHIQSDTIWLLNYPSLSS
jgi:hypothetical protein